MSGIILYTFNINRKQIKMNQSNTLIHVTSTYSRTLPEFKDATTIPKVTGNLEEAFFVSVFNKDQDAIMNTMCEYGYLYYSEDNNNMIFKKKNTYAYVSLTTGDVAFSSSYITDLEVTALHINGMVLDGELGFDMAYYEEDSAILDLLTESSLF